MKDSPRQRFQRPDSALADYLQDMLLPQADRDRSDGYQPARQARVAEPETPGHVSAGPGLEHGASTQPPRRATEWAEPSKLDPKVFAPRLPPESTLEPGSPVTGRPEDVASPPQVSSTMIGVKKTLHGPAIRVRPAQPPRTTQATDTKASESIAEPVPGIQRNRWVDGRPDWAQEPFDCLLFSVSGLKLAVPLILLGAVHPLDRDLTLLVGRPKWFMGLLTRGDRSTRVVDTAQWVLPERYRVSARTAYGFVIRLDDSEWGLGCDEVAQSFRLNPDEVKWRSADSQRPWLAGTVKSQMCALLDVGEFSRMLARAEKTQKFNLD